MICRLAIIGIVIFTASNVFLANYMLTIVCGMIALIHLLLRPYNNSILNIWDGIILQLLIFITALPLLDDFDSPMIIAMSFISMILPLILFFAMALFLHKNDLKKVVLRCTFKRKSPSISNNGNSNETPMKEFDNIIDDSVRVNATVCDMYVSLAN